jgi:type IV pilus assembly protein PilM
MDILGIDIGTVSVKYVRMRGKGTIVSRGEYAHKGGWEDLNFVLTEIKEKEGTDLEVAVAVSSQEILKRTFTIPVIPKEEAREAIEWSASKVVSSPLEDMIYQNVMLGEISERGMKKVEVLFVGANKEYINILLSIFENVGFRRIVTITDTGFLYLPISAEKKEGPVAVVDIGGRQTGIYISDDKKLRFVREILTASESFVDAIMSELDLSYDEAERYAIEKGFTEESTGILSVPLDRLAGEIQRTFNVYARKYPERPISKIYLAGRAARIPNLMDRMAETFAEELEYLAPPTEVEDQYLPAHTLCITAEPLVNLLPEKLKARKREMTLKSWVRIASICIVALLLVPSIGMLASFRKLQVAIRTENADVASKKEQLRLLAGITTASRYGEFIAVRREIEKKDKTFVMLLKYLSSQLPKDVYLKEIEFTDRNRKFDLASRDPTKELASKDGPSLRDAVKGAAKESLSGASLSGSPSQNPAQQSAVSGTVTVSDYVVTLRGNIFGDVDVQETALLNLVINLERSSLLRNVEVSKREVKEQRGKKALEFLIIARCAAYEI